MDAEWIECERGQDTALGQPRTSGEGPPSTWKDGVDPIHFKVETGRSVGCSCSIALALLFHSTEEYLGENVKINLSVFILQKEPVDRNYQKGTVGSACLKDPGILSWLKVSLVYSSHSLTVVTMTITWATFKHRDS